MLEGFWQSVFISARRPGQKIRWWRGYSTSRFLGGVGLAIV